MCAYVFSLGQRKRPLEELVGWGGRGSKEERALNGRIWERAGLRSLLPDAGFLATITANDLRRHDHATHHHREGMVPLPSPRPLTLTLIHPSPPPPLSPPLPPIPSPPPGFSPIQAAFAAARDNARPLIPAHTPKELATLIRQCWRYTPHGTTILTLTVASSALLT